MLKPEHLFARNAAHLAIVAYFYLCRFLPVRLAAFEDAGVKLLADVLRHGVGGGVDLCRRYATVDKVADGSDCHAFCCGEHFGSVGSVLRQDAVDVEHHQL